MCLSKWDRSKYADIALCVDVTKIVELRWRFSQRVYFGLVLEPLPFVAGEFALPTWRTIGWRVISSMGTWQGDAKRRKRIPWRNWFRFPKLWDKKMQQPQ